LAGQKSAASAGAISARLRVAIAIRQVERIIDLSILIMAEFTIQQITLHQNYI
jgi:hypothetical protein